MIGHRLAYAAEWVYYGFWWAMSHAVLTLPKRVLRDEVTIRPVFFWICTRGLVFGYLLTPEEREAVGQEYEAGIPLRGDDDTLTVIPANSVHFHDERRRAR